MCLHDYVLRMYDLYDDRSSRDLMVRFIILQDITLQVSIAECYHGKFKDNDNTSEAIEWTDQMTAISRS